MTKTTPAHDPSGFTLPDPLKLMDNLSKALQIGASLAQRMAERQQQQGINTADPEAAMKPVEPVIKTFTEIAQSYAQHPERWAEASWQLWQGYAQLMQNTWSRMLGESPTPVITPDRSDKRFKDPDCRTTRCSTSSSRPTSSLRAGRTTPSLRRRTWTRPRATGRVSISTR